MKKYIAALITSTILLNTYSASADVLCQRKLVSRNKAIQSIKVFEGDVCPKGHSLIMKVLGKSDVEELAKLTIASNDVAGPQGVQGEKGDKGDTGAQGIQGVQGIQGEQGEKGETGAQGIQGIQGVQGEKGDKGDQGVQGIQGIQGEKGDKGDQGIQGIQGIQGVQGEKGDKGDQGIQGIQGVQGEKGEQGIQGVQGIQGDPGTNGIDGVNGIVNIKDCVIAQGSRSGSGDETQTVACDAGLFLLHYGYTLSNDEAHASQQSVEYDGDNVPVGVTVRAYKAQTIFNNTYTLTVKATCCPYPIN